MPNPSNPLNDSIEKIIKKLLEALHEEPLLEAWAATDAVARGLAREIEVEAVAGDVERKLHS